LNVWREIAHLLPYESTLYVADQARVPYGSRSLAEVRDFAVAITQFLLAHRAKIIVIACHTISAAALHYLRREFPEVPIVGMEPAVKPAVRQTQSGVVGILATPVTFQGQLFADLVQKYAGGVRVYPQVCLGWVEAVESGALDTPATAALVWQHLAPPLAAGADHLVLGCTHYPFLRPVIERLAGESITIIDPAPAVARQTARLLAAQNMAAGDGRASLPQHTFCTTAPPAAFSALLPQLLPNLSPAEYRIQQIDLTLTEPANTYSPF
jgi:glutamate racemase